MKPGAVLVGRYEVVRELGAGGAGELLLVKDRKRDLEPCALKILRPRLRDPGLVPLFKSEFLLLADVTHDHIVGVREFGGLEGGEPFFTMDFVPGENCRSFVREDRLETGDYLDLAFGMLGALAHVHARGILHRDVKPENIIMRRGDGRLHPVLIDFGLAITAGAAPNGEATGTLPYIAPEVLAGAGADTRSDLFSLGMVLFEVATGREVAERRELLRSPATVLAPNRVRRTLRRSARGAVPRRFEDFVSRLLSPSRAGRFATATDALRDLAEIYGEDFDAGAVEIVQRPRLGEPPLVGRASALEELMQRVEALCESRLLEPLVVVAGPEGIGVSRLLATLRNHAAVSGCLVASGASLRELAGDLLLHPAVGDGSVGAGESPRQRVFRIDTTLHGLAPQEHPVLVLDDVDRMSHAACDALREWIGALERREGRARVLLVLGGRNVGEGPGVELLKTAGVSVPIELRDLAPLKRVDIRNALAMLLGQPRIPADVAQTLLRTTDGNPRLLTEVLQLLVDEGVLDLSGPKPVLEAERLKEVELPAGVAEAARRRVRQLAREPRRLVTRFAMIEQPLPFAAARALAGEHLAALLAARFLVRDRGRIRFPSDLMRRGADLLEGATRQKALRESARALAETAPEAAALLLAEAGELEEAREFGLPAARRLHGERRLEDARVLLQRLLGDEPDLATGALLVEVLFSSGRFGEAGDLGRGLAERDGDAELMLLTAAALRSAGRTEDSLRLLQQVDRGAQGELAVRVTNAKAAILDSLGRFDEALFESRRAEATAGSLLALEGRIARVRANILRRMGRPTAARRIEDALVTAPADLVGDHERRAALVNRALLHHSRGRMRESLRDLHAARALARRSGALAGEGRALYVLGTLFVRLGRPGRAVTLFERARGLFERTALEEEMGRSLVAEARALLLTGRATEAELRQQRAQNLPGFERLPRLGSETALLGALLAYLSGETRRAIGSCDEMLDQAIGPEETKAPTAILKAELVGGLGDAESAERAWRAALRQVWQERRSAEITLVRVGLAECAGARGAWHLAERFLARETDELGWKTAARARALGLRAAAALHRKEPAAAGRLLEETVVVANRCDDAPLRAEVYAAVASLLEEGDFQRWLRQPTAVASAALLEAAREVWMLYGNEKMLRKIDLHLSELPRPAADPLGGPEADRLVKVLHVTREMNREFDRDRLLGLILDRAIELTGAERGFVILLKEGRETVHLARNLDREAVSEPERKISSRIIQEVVRTGRIVRSENAEADNRFEEYISVRQLHLKSIIAVPFRSGGKTVGALYLDNRFKTGNFTESDERLLELFADQAVAAIDKAELVRELGHKREEVEELYRQQKSELKKKGQELKFARRELHQHRRARGWGFDKITSRSVAMQAIVREAKRVAATELPVLLTGENGTGKELLARAMHYGSTRQSMPFVAVNCAAFPEGLLEAELFGHVRGSFTGADRDRAGLFEEADGGTLFLDEVGDMALSMQVRLLRTLELGEVKRVGESKLRMVDVRVLSATNADLEMLIRNGRFREDLYYRLSGFVLRIPALRERLEDVEPLAYAFVEEAARREGRPGLSLTNDAIARLESFSWSGNVRELRNVILRAVVTAEGDTIRPEDIKFDTRTPTVLPGFDPSQADLILEELANRGLDLNPRQQTAINRVLTRGKLHFGEYQQFFRVSKSTTARDLEHLVTLGLLEKRGKTRAVIYLPGAQLQEVARHSGERRD
ncbi:MAG: sigma 54-interacting transcriptional regulator [Planctomycetota bacterium]